MEQQTTVLWGPVWDPNAAGVLLAIAALFSATHIEPSGDAAKLIHVFGSICIAALSLFLIASGVRAVEAAGVTSAGDQRPEDQSSA